MKWTFLFLVVLIQSHELCRKEALPGPDLAQEPPSHLAWDQLLRQHVNADGWVDYQSFNSDRNELIAYLKLLSDHPPSEQWSRQAQLAYYINLYNAATVLLILEHYPLESIRDIKRPWGEQRIQIGDQRYSLGEIEHGILRKMGEPRIHFAINCASVSCPKLLTEAFTEAALESQLEGAARDFINDPSRNDLSNGQARLSKIFKWYRKDFRTADTSPINYINRYLAEPLPANTRVLFLPYDWSLNEKKD
jgi:hypothetical protein